VPTANPKPRTPTHREDGKVTGLFISHSSRDVEVTARLVARLREAGFTALFIDFDPEVGIPAGRVWERELFAQLAKCDALVFVASPASVASQWCAIELASARSQGKPIFPVQTMLGVRHRLLDDVQCVDASEDEDAGFQRLLMGLQSAGLQAVDSFRWDPSRPAYPGLAAFGVADAGVFFGRDDEIRRLLERLAAPGTHDAARFIAVVGPSGSGKSSLLRAGLLPRLARQTGRWQLLGPLLPSDRPTVALARALAAAFRARERNCDRADVQRRLAEGSQRLIELLDDLTDLAGGQSRVLLAIDQAEELLTRSSNRERAQFLELLAPAMALNGPLWVVATLRAEFLARLAAIEGMAPLLDEPMVVGPLPRSRLAEVIARPAQRAGLQFQAGLIERMVDDTVGGDALPLLAYTLQQLADASEPGRPISNADYDTLGGVVGALTRQADRVTAQLQRQGASNAVLPALLRLTTVEAGGEPTRRRVPLTRFAGTSQEVIEAFVDARLLTTASHEDTTTVEVAHEALLRQWPPLRQAVEMSRRELELRADLERLAHDWNDADRDESYLLRGARLAQSAELSRTSHEELGHTERAYLAASQARASADLEHTRRTNRRLRRLVAGLAILLLAAITASGFALRATNTAQQQTLIARSRELAARAVGLLDDEPHGALLVALESFRSAPTNEAMAALTAGLSRPQHRMTKLTGHEHYVRSVAFAPDGATVASAGLDGRIRRWDAQSGEPIGTPIDGPGDAIWEVAYSPDGSELAAATGDGTIRRYDAVNGDPLGNPLTGNEQGLSDEPTYNPHPGLGGGIRTVAYSPTGESIVGGGEDGTVWRWAIAGGGSLGEPLSGPSVEVHDVAYSPDGRTIAAGGGDGSIRRWNALTGETLGEHLADDAQAVTTVSYSPDGQTLVAGGASGVRLWDVASGLFSHLPLAIQPDGATTMALDSDGTILATTGGDDGTIQLWDAATRAPLGTPLHRGLLVDEDDGFAGPQMGTGAWAVAISPDGQTIVGGYDDGIVLWNIPKNELLGRSLTRQGASFAAMALSPDGATIAVRDHNGEIWLMDAPTDQGQDSESANVRVSGAALEYSSDGRTLAACSGVDVRLDMRLWDGLHGGRLGVVKANDAHDDHRTINLTRVMLACLGDNGTVSLWDVDGRVALGRPLSPARDPDCDMLIEEDNLPCRRSTAATLSPDATMVAIGGSDGTVALWDMASRELLRTRATGSDHEINQLVFSPDGANLASISRDDDAIRLWSSDTLEPYGTLRSDDITSPSSVAFSPDGVTLAVGSDEGVQLWNVLTQTLLGTPRFDHVGTTQVRFSADGSTIVSLSQKEVRLWAAPHTWIAEICGIVGRNLTLREWARLMGPEAAYVRICPTLPAANQAPDSARAARYPAPLATAQN
jgi:WD40 repeat protein